METTEKTVIALGGSLIVPDAVDRSFLRKFYEVVKEEVAAGREFILVAGGGAICREYQAALRAIQPETKDADLDHMGIAATRYNAELLRLVFADITHDEVITDPKRAVNLDAPVVVKAAANTPGTSSDFGAVKMADAFGAHHLINLSNISHVYDKDPNVHDVAKPLDKLSWDDYLEKIPAEFSPGLHTPFDPVASRAAKKVGLEVAVISGADLDNLQAYLQGEEFVGTIIS